MKTIEEMRTAVCKHCDSVCPRDGVPTKIDIGSLVFGYVVDEHDNDFESWFVWLPGLSAPMALWSMADDGVWLAAYRLFNLESAELEQQLEEAKQVKLEGMEMPAYKLMQDFAKFMDEALESDRPRVTDWRVRIPSGEEVVVLNIWAATTHDSPISRSQELVGKVAELEARNAAL